MDTSLSLLPSPYRRSSGHGCIASPPPPLSSPCYCRSRRKPAFLHKSILTLFSSNTRTLRTRLESQLRSSVSGVQKVRVLSFPFSFFRKKIILYTARTHSFGLSASVPHRRSSRTEVTSTSTTFSPLPLPPFPAPGEKKNLCHRRAAKENGSSPPPSTSPKTRRSIAGCVVTPTPTPRIPLRTLTQSGPSGRCCFFRMIFSPPSLSLPTTADAERLERGERDFFSPTW